MTSPGLRERKRLATHRALSAAAWRLGLERGIDQVTVEDIAEAAGVSSRTFFNYFPNKGAAFIGEDLERGRRFVEAVTTAPDDAPLWQLLRRTAIETMPQSELTPGERILREQLIRDSQSVISDALAAVATLEQMLIVEIGRRIPDATPLRVRLVTNAVTAAVRAATETWLADEATATAERYVALLDEAFAGVEPTW